MRLISLFTLILLAAFLGCGGSDEPDLDTSTIDDASVTDDETAPLGTVNVYPGSSVRSNILWASCTRIENNDWREPYQPNVPGDTISFHVEPGYHYDLRCLDENLVHYYKWDVLIGEDGFNWEVTESDPDNLFRNYAHQTDFSKQVADVVLRNTHGLGVISSVITRHNGYHGEVVVEHLNNQFIQPNQDFMFRVRAGLQYTITAENTYGDGFLLMSNTTIGEDGVVLEMQGY